MASPREHTEGLIGGLYAIDFAQKLADAAAPLQAFSAARGDQPGCIAVTVARGWPARSRALAALAGVTVPNLMTPVAHGPAATPAGTTGYFVVCPAAPGRPLAATPRAWPEAELMDQLLKPACHVLAELQARSVTHRAIRADNLFQASAGMPVTLGCAWAAPPACHQPAWLEPIASAACLPTGRGDGVIADDVYALGALMMSLALGANPAEASADDELLRRKLEVGSFAALLGKHRLPATLADLLRGMLADDPEHRPSPALLSNPAAARARRVAARPPRRAQRPIEVGPHPAWTARMLAHELSRDPARGLTLLRDGSIGRWVHRGLGDSVSAGQIEAVVQQRQAEAATAGERADALLVTRAVAVLDPAAPLTWRSVTLWPDGLGPALDHALRHTPELAPVLAEIATARVPVAWDERRSNGREGLAARPDALNVRAWLSAAQIGANPARLAYVLNPLAPCDSPSTQDAWVIRLADLLPALEAHAAKSPLANEALVSAGVAAFVEARRDERLDSDLNRLAASCTAADGLSQLRLLARLQTKAASSALPRLSMRAVELVQPLLAKYKSRSRRERLAERLASLAEAGSLTPILMLLDSGAERVSDGDGLAAARARLAEIEERLIGLEASSAERPAQTGRIGREVAEGVGLVACLVGLTLAVFG